jgi:protein sidekick
MTYSCILLLVPGQPPHIVSVYNTSSTSLRVTWLPIPEKYLYGQLLGYRVFYKDTTTTNTSDYLSVDVGPDALEADITGLVKYRDHVVQVSGFNRQGEGIPSKGVIVSTDEDGKKY